MVKKQDLQVDKPVATLDDISKMKRSDIRYALFRCRTGNPDAEHSFVFSYYEPRLTKFGLTTAGFSTVWDVSKENPTDIVSGHIVGIYQQDLDIFNPDGALKD